MRSSGLARRIELLCRHYLDGEVDELADGDDAAAALVSRIVAAVRDGARDAAQLEKDLDELESVAVASRLDGLTTTPRTFRRPPRPTDGHPLIYVLQCPLQVCSRSEIDYGGASSSAACGMSGGPLKRIRLEP